VPRNVPLASDFSRSPLRAHVFASALENAHLTDQYPSLVHNIIHGFPIGLNMPHVSQNFLPQNHYKTVEEDQIIQAKLANEVNLGRMSGPFSVRQAESFFGGPFRTAPLAIVPKPGVGPDQWRMVQNLSFRDQFGMSVNDFIDSDDFPTKWGTAQMMADWVSLFMASFSSFHPPVYLISAIGASPWCYAIGIPSFLVCVSHWRALL
jgi:hypothetical protein